ncbi:MAG: hypothetical protein RBT11_02290 [Desulfobacterales bacterium]|jgi:hypothetical protein|nr:hypothetical protein [Desulfobacterales bacterium]
MKIALFSGFRLVMVLLLVLLIPTQSPCKDTPALSLPKDLADWSAWVLYGKERALCPSTYNDGEALRCQWPSRLQLDIDATCARFEQSWLMFAPDWVPLPGSADTWPQSVMLDNTPVPVLTRNASPYIRLPSGEHRVSGRFNWKKMPEMILVPPTVGLVDLQINNRKIDFPELDEKGRLWIQHRNEAGAEEERLSVRLFRLIDDTIPMQITTLARIEVSGRPREIRLENLLPDNAIPLRLESVLPAKLTAEGALVCQVRPGRWELSITTRQPDSVAQLSCRGAYGAEVWSFQSRNHLRMVEISGAPSVEPDRTDMPEHWKGLPAYGLNADTIIKLKEIRRGDPNPAPDRLALHRTWWLDFDGSGYTIQDTITGTISRQWYLAMTPPGELGRAALDGIDQLITQQGKDNLPGVALRRGNLNLVADSRLNLNRQLLPAVGWQQDFEKVSGLLHLPPGWRLLATSGVDRISGTWIQKWSLLDFFLALIISLSVFKLRGWKWGIIALFTMMLIFHEPGAPRLVWLHLIAALALIKILPDGWVKKGVRGWGFGAAATLLVLAIPFMVQQIRWGVYPQLAPVGWTAGTDRAGMQTMAPPSFEAKSDREGMGAATLNYLKETKTQPLLPSAAPGEAPMPAQAVLATDPDALIQTGPGLPTWTWRTFTLAWNGPVERTQAVRLWLLSPGVNLVLGILRTLLLALLIVGLLDMRLWWQTLKQNLPAMGVASILVLILLSGGISRKAQAAYPPEALLQQLQERLLEKPDCLPDCADIMRMAVTIDPDHLQVMLEIHAAADTAVPLPATRSAWTPEAIMMDQQPLPGLSRDETGTLWALIPEGVHTVVLTGKTAGDVMQLPLPLAPHSAGVESTGWTIRGIHPDGSVDTSLQMTRITPSASSEPGQTSQPLSAFFHIQRVIHLGLTWQVTTTVDRMNATGAPVTLFYPLLATESVTTPGIHVEGHTAQIVIPPQMDTFQFTSSLDQTQTIALRAPEAVPWTESWILDASPIWQCDFSGIPLIHHQDQAGQWQPEWSPWPGERLAITVSRPKAIAGKMITIDAARLDWTPGLRFNQAVLHLSLRTSRGGQHDIRLPESAALQEVKINGQSLPIRLEGTQLTIPLQPGTQNIRITWHQPGASRFFMRSPQIVIGTEAVNADVTFHMPRNCWTLLAGGPRLGPAVLFWSYLGVVILAAFGLKRIRLTPLKLHQWLLLGLGLTQVPPLTALVVVGWLPALGLRKEKTPPDKWLPFNAFQLLLVFWTIAALSGLYAAVERGLLGIPDMQIAGNQSSNYLFHWTQDRISLTMPRPWALSLPLWVYRVLMLLWSLWLAFSLLKWLRWGWQCFSSGNFWKKAAPRKPRGESRPGAGEAILSPQKPPEI